jgi:hypothetical protein
MTKLEVILLIAIVPPTAIWWFSVAAMVKAAIDKARKASLELKNEQDFTNHMEAVTDEERTVLQWYRTTSDQIDGLATELEAVLNGSDKEGQYNVREHLNNLYKKSGDLPQ